MTTQRAPLDRLLMSSIVMAALIALGGCEREQRSLHTPSPRAMTVSLTPGTQPRAGAVAADLSFAYRDENNVYEVAQGKLLFNAYNCTGCHAQGGGGRGPALMDDIWIYGAEPENVFASIVGGRPNGMPSFGSRIPEYQVWQLVAYVRSMSGLVDPNAAPGRDDAMHGKQSEQLADPQPPRMGGAAAKPEQPK